MAQLSRPKRTPASRAVGEGGVVGNDAGEAGEEGGGGVFGQEKDEGEGGSEEIGRGCGCREEALFVLRSSLFVGGAGDPEGVEREGELGQGEGQRGGFDGGGDAGEEPEDDGGRSRSLAHRDKEEGGGGDEEDGHGEVALSAFGETVAAVDEDEEGRSEQGREPSIMGSHPSQKREGWGTRASVVGSHLRR